MADLEQVKLTLGRNVSSARTRKRLTQEELAKLSNLPRSTLSDLETGHGNPSLDSLGRVSEALNIGIDELLVPRRHIVWGVTPFEAELEELQLGQVRIWKLLPAQVSSIELRKIEIAAGGKLTSGQKPALSREFLTILAGQLTLRLDETSFHFGMGESVQFRCDQPYSYENSTCLPACAISTTLQVTMI